MPGASGLDHQAQGDPLRSTVDIRRPHTIHRAKRPSVRQTGRQTLEATIADFELEFDEPEQREGEGRAALNEHAQLADVAGCAGRKPGRTTAVLPGESDG